MRPILRRGGSVNLQCRMHRVYRSKVVSNKYFCNSTDIMKRKSTFILADATMGKPTVLNRRKNKVTLFPFLVSSFSPGKIARFLQLHSKRSVT